MGWFHKNDPADHDAEVARINERAAKENARCKREFEKQARDIAERLYPGDKKAQEASIARQRKTWWWD